MQTGAASPRPSVVRHLSPDRGAPRAGRGVAVPAAVLAVLLLAGGPVGPVAAEARPGPAVPWSWPVPEPHLVLRPFVAPEHRWSPGHRGVDLAMTEGGAVSAPDDGVVHFAGTVVDRPVLSLRHAGGVLSSMEPVSTELRAGDVVQRGQAVGVLEPGHGCAAPCMHLGARIDGEYVSPLMMLGLGRASVLLPTRHDEVRG
ncbi:murein DD-endopeptidase MepM/ murein hydrolase activator NlpD [Frigoribacterium sp. PvP120]